MPDERMVLRAIEPLYWNFRDMQDAMVWLADWERLISLLRSNARFQLLPEAGARHERRL